MIANHYNDIDSEYVLDEGGMGSRDALAPNKLVFGVAVGDKVLMWLRLRAKGTAGHGSQYAPPDAKRGLPVAFRPPAAPPESCRSPPPGKEHKLRARRTLVTA